MSKISCNLTVRLGPVKRQLLSDIPSVGLLDALKTVCRRSGALFEYWVMWQIMACDRFIGDLFDKIFLEICVHDLIVLLSEVFIVTNSLYKGIKLDLSVTIIDGRARFVLEW